RRSEETVANAQAAVRNRAPLETLRQFRLGRLRGGVIGEVVLRSQEPVRKRLFAKRRAGRRPIGRAPRLGAASVGRFFLGNGTLGEIFFGGCVATGCPVAALLAVVLGWRRDPALAAMAFSNQRTVERRKLGHAYSPTAHYSFDEMQSTTDSIRVV